MFRKKSTDQSALASHIKKLRRGVKGSPSDQLDALRRIEAIGSEAVPPLIEVLSEVRLADVVVKEIVALLGRLGDKRAVAPILQRVERGAHSEEAYHTAYLALRQLGDRRAIEPLIARLGGSPSLKEETLQDLKENGVSQTDLLTILSTATTWQLQQGIRTLLPAFADESATPTLIDALKSSEPERQKSAAGALGDMKVKEAVDPLMPLLTDSEWTVRAFAATALGDIGELRAADAISDLLNDPDPNVRVTAAKALANLGHPLASERIQKALTNEQDVKIRQLLGMALASAMSARPTPSAGARALHVSSVQEEEADHRTLLQRQSALLQELAPIAANEAISLFEQVGIAEPNRYSDASEALAGFRQWTTTAEGVPIQRWYLKLHEESAGNDFLYMHLADVPAVGFLVCALKEGGHLGYYKVGSGLKDALGV